MAHDSVVEEIASALAMGKTILLQGPNGCGKSTLIRELMGLQAGSIGSGNFRWLPQELERPHHLSVRDLLWAHEQLELSKDPFGIAMLLHSEISALSGGEWRRVQIHLALGFSDADRSDKRVLLLDEPTNDLDSEGCEILLGCLEKFARSSGSGLLVASHDKTFSTRLVQEFRAQVWAHDGSRFRHLGLTLF